MLSKRTTYVVLGIFLILTGLLEMITSLSVLGQIRSILALVAGILILAAKPGISNKTGWIIAAIYLIGLGLSGLMAFSFSGMGMVMAVLAITAGAVLFMGWPGFSHHLGFILFCGWLILVGLAQLAYLRGLGTIIAVTAIVSGTLLILNE